MLVWCQRPALFWVYRPECSTNLLYLAWRPSGDVESPLQAFCCQNGDWTQVALRFACLADAQWGSHRLDVEDELAKGASDAQRGLALDEGNALKVDGSEILVHGGFEQGAPHEWEVDSGPDAVDEGGTAHELYPSSEDEQVLFLSPGCLVWNYLGDFHQSPGDEEKATLNRNQNLCDEVLCVEG